MDIIKQELLNHKENPIIDKSDALELFKIYHDSIEKVAEKRQKANSFFMTLNTGIIAIIGFLFQKDTASDLKLLYLFLPFVGIISGIYWYQLVVSYRQLNKGKFAVLNIIEEYLTLAPYKAEWFELGEGKDKKKYKPLTHTEQRIPIVFIIMYLFLSFYFIYLFLKDSNVFC